MNGGDGEATSHTTKNLISSGESQDDSSTEHFTNNNISFVLEENDKGVASNTDVFMCGADGSSENQTPYSKKKVNPDFDSVSSAKDLASSLCFPEKSQDNHSPRPKPELSAGQAALSSRTSKISERSGYYRLDNPCRASSFDSQSSNDMPSEFLERNSHLQDTQSRRRGSSSLSGDSIQEAKTEENQKQEKVTMSSLPDTRIVWGASLVILTSYVVAMMTLPALSTQYLNYKIGKDDYNFTYKPGDRHSDCSNSSNKHKDLLNKIQRDTSKVVLIASMASGIPASLACLVVGSYSDFLGRRPLIIASVLGGVARAGSLTAVIYFDLPVQLFYLGSFVDGALGSYFTLALAITAVIADITPVPEARALRFAVVEGTLFTAGALAQLAIGFMIKWWDYFAPSAFNSCLLVFASIVTITCLPETMTRSNNDHFGWNPFLHLRKVFGFYFVKTPGNRRSLYIIGLGFFLFLILTNHGRTNVETLFVLNAPICWNSINIGVFQSLRLILCSVVAVIVLRLFRYRLSLEAIGMICGLSAAAGFAMESLAKSGIDMYLSGIVGVLFVTAIPIPRAILSQMTSPTKQGALFSSLAFVDTAGSMFASLIYTLIYNATLNTFKGAVFVLMAALCCVNVLFLGAFWWVRSKQSEQVPDSKTEQDVIVPSSSSSSFNDEENFVSRDSLIEAEKKNKENLSSVGRKAQTNENTPLLMA
ncbi:hypothetical protein RRG08_001516 [Elysia crispata]|uniref:Proton-coupled folate transporter n=1 Tax=Elysia crispata TaxID=231223 RepID=A0AAE1AAB3_9GAST|nr:hypothetical protein RRG08_001516 [Elysia crispata]